MDQDLISSYTSDDVVDAEEETSNPEQLSGQAAQLPTPKDSWGGLSNVERRDPSPGSS